MFINWALQEINLKIVYYGPGMSGKTTNLEYIHTKLDPSLTGELVSLKTKEDRFEKPELSDSFYTSLVVGKTYLSMY